MIFLQLKDFIGKVVIHSQTKQRFALHAITAPYIDVTALQKNFSGYYPSYRYRCDNSDPISDGTLVFEDATLKEPFCQIYTTHSHSEAGYWDTYGYYMK